MKKSHSLLTTAFWLIAGVVVVDQITKMVVLNTMHRGQSIQVLGNFLKLTFTENPGMAFGLRFGPPWLVTAFSIFATFLIVLYLVRVGKVYRPYQVALSLVLGGAVGNIIDRVFYGAIRGTSPMFQGKVVDFIHVNVWEGRVAESIPLIGGNYLALFPIWNVADMAIVVGVVGIVFFQKRFHLKLEGLEGQNTTEKQGPFDHATVMLDEPVVPNPDLERLANKHSPGNTEGDGDDSR